MPSRRDFLLGTTVPAVVGLSVILASPDARADSKIPKKQADYQWHPHDGARCSQCCMFIPGHPAHCTMMQGVIDPNGWCKYFKSGPADTCS